MTERQSFTKLRDTLVYLYEDEAAARRVAGDAELDIGQIPFSTRAIDNWNNILHQAQREGKTAKLMAITFKEYKENERVATAWHDYLVAIGKGVETTRVYLQVHDKSRQTLVWSGVVVTILIVFGVVFLQSPILQFLGFSLATPKNILPTIATVVLTDTTYSSNSNPCTPNSSSGSANRYINNRARQYFRLDRYSFIPNQYAGAYSHNTGVHSCGSFNFANKSTDVTRVNIHDLHYYSNTRAINSNFYY